ncbi:MAG: hypothetical protein HKP10_02375 [Kiritimatiellales bacterium]|nr:hypothetical protein [Kiritimatiellales bacterium]
MNAIDALFEPYAELETAVRGLMIQLCGDTCGICTVCCCRADICEEAIESAFLRRLLAQQGLTADHMDDRIGWLDLKGCSLEYGRPPVCYAYFCDELLARFPDDDARQAARTLGRLMHHVGQDALDGWHLVEIKQEDDLARVNPDPILHRLKEARSAFDAIERFIASGHLDRSDRHCLARITTDEP